MSKETIYREDAIKAVWKPQVKPNELIFDALKTAIESEINNVPSADRPQGEWIWSPRDTDGTVSGCCSNCSFSHLFIGGHTAQYNYCPNCGARMKGADDGSC